MFVLRCRETGEAVLIDAANEHEQLLELCQRSRRPQGAGDPRPLGPHPGRSGNPRGRLRGCRDSGRRAAAEGRRLRRVHRRRRDHRGRQAAPRSHPQPGPHAGSVSFKVQGAPLLFSGDTLFPGGPGNTKLEGGDFATIIHSIDTSLFTLPADTIVMPGHGVEHDHRPRATAPRRLGRSWLVATSRRPRCATTNAPPTTPRSTPRPFRRHRRATATSSRRRGSRPRRVAGVGRRPARQPRGRVQAPDRRLVAVARRARGGRRCPLLGRSTPTICHGTAHLPAVPRQHRRRRWARAATPRKVPLPGRKTLLGR